MYIIVQLCVFGSRKSAAEVKYNNDNHNVLNYSTIIKRQPLNEYIIYVPWQ